MRSMPWLAALGLLVVMAPGAGHAIPRDRIVANGLAYGGHVWTPSAENVAVPAPCSNDWEPRHVAGQQYTGLPYDWGGYVTLPQFDADLAEGLRAGSYPSEGILECTTGVVRHHVGEHALNGRGRQVQQPLQQVRVHARNVELQSLQIHVGADHGHHGVAQGIQRDLDE